MSEKNIDLVKAEIKRGVERHGNYNSSHEAYAVLLEEVDELWDEIKKRHQDYPAMKKEAIQVAAIAIRFCDEIDEILAKPNPPAGEGEENDKSA